MIIRKKNLYQSLAVISGICSIHMFGLYHSISDKLYDLIDVIFYAVVFFVLLRFLRNDHLSIIPKSKWLFSKNIFIFYIFLAISSLSCLFFHGQNPLLTVLAMREFVFFIFYFVLLFSGLDKDKIIKIMLAFWFAYIIVFSLQLLIFPHEIVPLGRTTEFDRGFLRLRLEGVGFLTLSGFYFLNQYLSQHKKVNLILFFVSFTFVFILGFRTLTVTYLLSSILLFIMVKGVSVRLIISMLPIFLLALIVTQTEFFQMFIEETLLRTEEQLSQGADYIRFLTFEFLYTNVNENWVSVVFGNGRPFLGSGYGNYVLGYGAESLGFIAADLGLIGFSFYYGVLSTFCFLAIFLKGILVSVDKNSLFLKTFFIYLIISSITTAEIFRAGMYGPICIALYLINLSHYKLTNESLKIRAAT